MSQSTAVRAPRATPRTAPTPSRAPAPRLRVVDLPAHTRSRAGLVVACLGLLALGLVALLVLNVSLERGAYELRSQRARSVQLTEQRQALQEQLAALQAPEALATRAAALGMVPAPNAVFLRRSDGAVLGVPSQAAAGRAPTVTKAASNAVASPAASGATSSPKATPSASASTKATTKATTAPATPGTATTGTTRTATTKPAATKTGKPVPSPKPTAH